MIKRTSEQGTAWRRRLAVGATLALLPSLTLAGQGPSGISRAAATPLPGTSAAVGAVSTTEVLARAGHGSGTQAKWAFSYHRTGVFRTSQGYTYRLTLELEVGRPGMGSSASLPPGRYAVVEPVAGALVVANLTGRDARDPLPFQATDVYGLWRAPTPLCPPNAFGATPDAEHEVIGGKWYCRVTFATVSGGVVTLSPHQHLKESEFHASGPGAATEVIAMSRGQVPRVMAALGAGPAMVLMGFAISNTPEVVCDNQGGASWVVHANVPLPARSCH